MNNDSGFGANGAPFEYAVAEAKTKKLKLKKAGLLCAYVLWGAIALIGGASTGFLPILCFIPLTIWILVFFTWKYTQIEYEYSFFSGKLTVSKILGGRSRKKMTEVMILIFPLCFSIPTETRSRQMHTVPRTHTLPHPPPKPPTSISRCGRTRRPKRETCYAWSSMKRQSRSSSITICPPLQNKSKKHAHADLGVRVLFCVRVFVIASFAQTSFDAKPLWIIIFQATVRRLCAAERDLRISRRK